MIRMPPRVPVLRLLLSVSLLWTTAGWALDGKWTPAQLSELDPAWLREQGLELAADEIWDAEQGRGLLSAAVRIGGCSGAFVSAEGLVLTNHHCLFGLVQEHSSTERDLIRDGYLAPTREAELPGRTLRVEVPQRFSDVTESVLAAVPPGADPLQRLHAIDDQREALRLACEGERPDIHCKVAVYDEGVQYVLIEWRELRDVRLVYAPPRAVGEYGGEIDNWMWPRHTGDFALARVWHSPGEGEPAQAYRPERFIPIASQPLQPDDFVMVLGYPGITYRSLIADEMAERRERYFVRRETLFGQWMSVIETATAEDPAGQISVASNLKGLANRYKNAQGQIAGLDRGAIVEQQRRADAAVLHWASEQADAADIRAAHAGLTEVLEERLASWEHDFLLNLMAMGNESVPGGIPPLPKSLYFGATLAHLARELEKPDAKRDQDFRESEWPRLRDRLQREQHNLHRATDEQLLLALLQQALALPDDQRLAAVDRHVGQLAAAALPEWVAKAYERSVPLDPARREALIGQPLSALQALQDPLLDLAIDWNADLRALRERERGWRARAALHRPIWRRAVARHAGRPLAPDANGSLRISLAHVQGYAPRDGVWYTPFTTLAGLLAKHTGNDPFDAPAALLEAARGDQAWRELPVSQLPIDFLADGDTSGGNSGSPVLNGRGELVGVNFDRVWENVAGDFGFNPALSRNVSVDVRYLLWLLERVERADALLGELGFTASASD